MTLGTIVDLAAPAGLVSVELQPQRPTILLTFCRDDRRCTWAVRRDLGDMTRDRVLSQMARIQTALGGSR